MKIKKETKYHLTLNEEEARSLFMVLNEIHNKDLIQSEAIEKNICKIIDTLVSFRWC